MERGWHGLGRFTRIFSLLRSKAAFKLLLLSQIITQLVQLKAVACKHNMGSVGYIGFIMLMVVYAFNNGKRVGLAQWVCGENMYKILRGIAIAARSARVAVYVTEFPGAVYHIILCGLYIIAGLNAIIKPKNHLVSAKVMVPKRGNIGFALAFKCVFKNYLPPLSTSK